MEYFALIVLLVAVFAIIDMFCLLIEKKRGE